MYKAGESVRLVWNGFRGVPHWMDNGIATVVKLNRVRVTVNYQGYEYRVRQDQLAPVAPPEPPKVYESPCEFHVQLWEGDWVIWGYGPLKQVGGNVRHTAPAVVTLGGKGKVPLMDFPFELPKPYEGGGEPQEYERKHAWGWQFRSNDLRVDTGWHLAETREQAIEDARVWAEEQDSRDGWVYHGHREPMAHAVRDVRQYQCFFD
jgi:hypothetical protein